MLSIMVSSMATLRDSSTEMLSIMVSSMATLRDSSTEMLSITVSSTAIRSIIMNRYHLNYKKG